MTMFRGINSEGRRMRWGYLKPTVIFLGLLMLLFIAPVSNASQPQTTTLNGEWSAVSDTILTGKGVSPDGERHGPLVITAETVLTFEGEVAGDVTGSLVVYLQPKGHFTVVTTGEFVGTIDGKVGTAQFNTVVNGFQQPPDNRFPCCYEGPINFYDGEGGLEGLTAKGVFTRDPDNRQRYSLDVIFR